MVVPSALSSLPFIRCRYPPIWIGIVASRTRRAGTRPPDGFERWAEGFAQQTDVMELLEPLGIAHVGLLAGNAIHMAGFDQIDINARLGQDIVKRDPVVAGAFHAGGLDITI